QVRGVSGVADSHKEDALAMAEAGGVRFGPIITHRYPLDRIEEALSTMRGKAAGFIKAVIRP
ncbi:MAG: hypothetical protein FWE70_07850, partial [Oscillospiraceae bacterium]|nr:hypothetical protein [Oscillospiraceae bacterium]